MAGAQTAAEKTEFVALKGRISLQVQIYQRQGQSKQPGQSIRSVIGGADRDSRGLFSNQLGTVESEETIFRPQQNRNYRQEAKKPSKRAQEEMGVGLQPRPTIPEITAPYAL